MIVRLWLGCGPPPLDVDAPAPFAPELATFAAERIGPASYADPRTSRRFSPDGVLFDVDGTLWVWSAAQPQQVGFRIIGDGWERIGERTGPLRTRRCVVLGRTWCVGEREPGGIRDPADPTFRTALPARGGFRDLAVVGGQVRVLDAVDERVVALDVDGTVVGAWPVPAAPLRIGPLGDDRLWVLSGTRPYLAVLGPDGLIAADLRVPARDAVWDPLTDRLWTVGPAERPVSRKDGPLVGPGTEVLGWDRVSLGTAGARPVERQIGTGVDGTGIVATPDGPAVVYSGSDVVDWRGRKEPAGLAPSGLAFAAGDLAVAAPQSDAVVVLGRHPAVLKVDDRPRDTLEDLGQRLLSSPAPWENTQATCVGCHWDGLVDHRQHPGIRETRWEQSRPFVGIGSLAPIFSPGQAKTLAIAVEGLVRGLDDRYSAPSTEPWWLAPRTVQTVDGPRSLSALEVRQALIAALTAWPVERGPLAGAVPDAVRRRGLGLLVRDCVRCHEAAGATFLRDRVPDDQLWDVVGTRPLVFAAPLFARAGPKPYTPRGNRVPPLWMLDRGGPFLTDGSADTLDVLLQRTDPGGPAVHGRSGDPVYGPEDRAALIAVLLSL